jgi:hypothetical protein
MHGEVERDRETIGEWRKRMHNLNEEGRENCTHPILSDGSLMATNCREDLVLETGGFYG